MTLKKILTIAGLVSTLIAATTGLLALDSKYAKQKQLEKVEAKVEKGEKKFATVQDIVVLSNEIRLNALRNELLYIERRIYEKKEQYRKTHDQDLLDEIEDLKIKKKRIEDEIFRIKHNG
ncbi:MAG: hypothetical protein PVG65_00850 [Candidatus Thorarchaeota archaeon]|jgi:hypothetical protein